MSVSIYLLLKDGQTERGETTSLVRDVDGVQVRLAEVEYSSTSTRLVFELRHPYLESSREGALFSGFPSGDLAIEGFEPVARIEQRRGRAVEGIDRREIRLGAVQEPSKPVVFEIKRLCLYQSADTPLCDYRDGPWRFEWVPGSAAVDPISVTIPVNESQTIDGITVRVGEVKVSSSEIVVSVARFAGNRQLPQFGPDLEIVLPDGKVVHGEGGGGTSEDPPDMLKIYRFPSLPQGVREFTLRPPLTLTKGPAASIEISLQGLLDGVDLNSAIVAIPVEASTVVAGETMRVDALVIDQGKVRIQVKPVSASPRVLFSGTGPEPVVLIDSNGTSYGPVSGGVGFGKDLTGIISGRITTYEFEGVDLSAASRLRLLTAATTLIHAGGWEFHIRLP
jgi:hypothetical protein